MHNKVSFTLNGRPALAPAGTSVAAAALNNGLVRFCTSASGTPRAPLCGMGICYECRLTIDGRAHQRSCILNIAQGMVLQSDE